MSKKSTKNRVITIRVSDEEHQEFLAATQSKGYRSVSELARAAMHTIAGEQLAPHQLLARRIDEQFSRLAALSCELERLRTQVPS